MRSIFIRGQTAFNCLDLFKFGIALITIGFLKEMYTNYPGTLQSRKSRVRTRISCKTTYIRCAFTEPPNTHT